jgi:hypothetical protein
VTKARHVKPSRPSIAKPDWTHFEGSKSSARHYANPVVQAALDHLKRDTPDLVYDLGDPVEQAHALAALVNSDMGSQGILVDVLTTSIGSTLLPVQQAFLTRATRGVEDLLRTLTLENMTHAISAPTDAGVLLEALEKKESLGVLTQDPLAEARLLGQRRLMQLLEAEGGPLGSDEVAERLRISRQAVVKRRNSGTLLGLEIGTRFLYPSWQIDGSKTLRGLELVLKALQKQDEWRRLSFFVNKNIRLDGRSPLAVLRAGDVTSVVNAAEALLEHGAS